MDKDNKMKVNYKHIFKNNFQGGLQHGTTHKYYYPYDLLANEYSNSKRKVSKGYIRVDDSNLSEVISPKIIRELKLEIQNHNKSLPQCKTYLTHNNGSKKFKVCIHNNKNDNIKIKIFVIPEKYRHISKDLKKIFNEKDIFIELVEELSAKKVFIGSDNNEHKGNTILVNLNDPEHSLKYVYISSLIYEFTAKSEIIEYYSPLRQYDISYAFAKSKNEIYYMNDKKFFLRKNFEKYASSDCIDISEYIWRGDGMLGMSFTFKDIVMIYTL